MPWLSSKDFRPSTRAAENIVEDDIPGNDDELLVKEAGDHELKELQVVRTFKIYDGRYVLPVQANLIQLLG